MRPRATMALLESVSTSPSRRTGKTTMVTRLTKTNSPPTLMAPSARNIPPAISTKPICPIASELLMPQYIASSVFTR